MASSIFSGASIRICRLHKSLSFISEYQLTIGPSKMDVLVIKKEKDVNIEKNIGKTFRTHTIIEYKSPDDYISIDDFYKVLGYTTVYKWLNKIDISDLTMTFVETRYPTRVNKTFRRAWIQGC